MNSTVLAFDENRSIRYRPEILSQQKPYTTLFYAQAFRVIGQQLEPIKPETVDIAFHNGSFLVRCLTKHTEKQLRLLPIFVWVQKHENLWPAGLARRLPKNLELLYTVEDIEFLEQQRKGKRCDPRGMPDPFCLSNILRAIGWFLDEKNGTRLVLASYEAPQVLIMTETAQGVRKVDEFPMSILYDQWVKLYLKKKNSMHLTREL